jgi:hypothetical protein
MTTNTARDVPCKVESEVREDWMGFDRTRFAESKTRRKTHAISRQSCLLSSAEVAFTFSI